MIKTNIKMRVTPEQLRRVHEICFSNGVYWNDSGNGYIKLNENFSGIYIEDNILFECIGEIYFSTLKLEEINADLFIKTNGTCEETYLAKDIESALKKIENLHIALKKKVDKNKNQALEITKLLEQKKDLQQQIINESKGCCDLKKEIDDLQEINDSHVEYIKELENRLNQLSLSGANTNDTNNYIDDLRSRLKEKDIIIAYLRSELK